MQEGVAYLNIVTSEDAPTCRRFAAAWIRSSWGVSLGPIDWTIVGGEAAVAAAIIALITLFAVFAQVSLARKELRLVAEDLAYSREQATLLSRRANLFCFLREQICGFYPRDGGANAVLKLSVCNNGTKGARGVTVQVMLPSELSPSPYAQDRDATSHWRRLERVSRDTENGKGVFTIYEAHSPLSCFAGCNTLLFDTPVIVLSDDFRSPMYFRIMYDDGTTPPGTEFGLLTTLEEAQHLFGAGR